MTQNPTVDAYIGQFPSEVQEKLSSIREMIHSIAPDAEETIKYGIPTYMLAGKNMMHFAGYAHHIGVYPTPGGIEHFKDDLADYTTAKGSVQFPHTAKFPLELIRKIIHYQVEQTRSL